MTPTDAWAALADRSAAPFAGRARYAAAMALWAAGELPEPVLEAYRICARLDAADPLDVLARREGEAAAESLRRALANTR